MLGQLLPHALRALRTTPGLVAAAVATLGLGIGANAAVFGALNALLFRPLPIADADRLVYGLALRDGFDPFATSVVEYEMYAARAQSLERSGLCISRFVTLQEGAAPERVPSAAVSASFLETLRVVPAVGRVFTGSEDRPGGPAVALVSHALWQTRFGSDRSVVGRALRIDGRATTIVGVMPPSFDLPFGAQIWVPLQLDPAAMSLQDRLAGVFTMVARLGPGVTLARADAELKQLAAELAGEYPVARRGWTYRVIPLRQQLIGDLDGRTRDALSALAAGVALLLLICCGNVSALLLVRGAARQHEVAVRMAIGASRGRIVALLLT